MSNIRNFCIVAHIDHGKSTLADRFLELTGTIERRKMKEQFLDQMDLEREKGITIKMQPVRMVYHPRGLTQTYTQTNADKIQTPYLLYEDITYKIRGACFAVKQSLGLGHKEIVYQKALEVEFNKIGLHFESQKIIDVLYNNQKVGTYIPDFIIEEKIIIELKSLPAIGKPQEEQLWSYLKGSQYQLALLVNFGSSDVTFKRIVYEILRQSASSQRGSAQVEDEYILNLIDTPGHADFSYEVSRSLAAVEGVILLVDATKGVQAQTLAHLHHAQEQNLVIVPAVNKIDSPLARTEEVVKEIASLLQVDEHEILRISAKEGTHVQELLDAVIQRVPAPQGEAEKPLRALIFDSVYDSFRGIIAYVRVMEGRVQAGERISFCATLALGQVKEVGYFLPQQNAGTFLAAGDIGYVATGLKDPKEVRIGDTIIKSAQVIRLGAPSHDGAKSELALPGFTIPKPMVFASLYPQDIDDFDTLKTALSQLQLNDPSFVFEQEAKESLGRGFRCGFLGVLHSEIIVERIQREFHIEMVVSRPSVEFHITDKAGEEHSVKTPADWLDANTIAEIQEPICKFEIIAPVESFSFISQLLLAREGIQLGVTNLVQDRLLLSYRIPLREIVGDLHDQLKSASKGLASMDYEVQGWERADVVKLEIHVAGKNEEALSIIVSRHKAYNEGKILLEKLKDSLPSQQFEVALQAVCEGRVIARETMKAQRRDVTAPLYGGDVTRKRKLLEIQKKGKKELKAKGRVIIPTRVFLDLFRT